VIVALAVLAQMSVTAAAPETISVREPLTVTVRVAAPAIAHARLMAPSFSPLSYLRSSVTTRVDSTYIGGAWRVDEYRYVLVAPRAGRYTVGAFVVTDRGSTVRSRPLSVLVREAQESGVPAVVQRAHVDPRRNVDFHALVVPETVYVGQQATYEAGIFLDDDTRQRLRRNPEFVPPEPRSMLTYDVAAANVLIQQWRSGNRRYEVHVFQRALFPLAAGRYEIPGAELTYALPVSPSFFSREESFSIRSESAWVVAIDPPEAGRPPDFNGAVGELSVDARFDSTAGRVGNPTVLTVRVRGRGNVKLFPRPTLALEWASVVPAEERVQLDTQSLIVRGAKEFDWIVTPRRAGRLTMPVVRYPYFDPFQRRYELAASQPETLVVSPGSLAAVDSTRADSARVPSLRTVYRGALAPPLDRTAPFWLAVLLAPVPALVMGAIRRPRRRQRPRPAREALQRLARGGPAGRADARIVRRAYLAALSERVGLRADTAAHRGALTRALRRVGVTPETAEAAESLLITLDAAAFGRAGRASNAQALAVRAVELAHAIDREARTRAALSGVLVMVVAATIGAAAWSGARSAIDTAPSLFAGGVIDYEAHQYAEAARLFAAAADREPRAADAWANAGSASWMVADTAQAAVRWQRSVRLEPGSGSDDVRRALDFLPVGDDGGFGIAGVPRLPVDLAAWTALLLWIGGSGLVFTRLWRRARWATPAAAAALAVAAVAGLVARDLDDRARARDLAVSLATAPLRTLPALGAERSGTIVVGDVARTLGRQAAWTRVALDGGRDGWVETAVLASLASP
jgi:BatD DUF11 like domain